MIWVDFRQHITYWIQHFVAIYIRLNVANHIAQNQGSFLAAMANGKGEFLFKVFFPGSFFLDQKNDLPRNEKQTIFFLALIIKCFWVAKWLICNKRIYIWHLTTKHCPLSFYVKGISAFSAQYIADVPAYRTKLIRAKLSLSRKVA